MARWPGADSVYEVADYFRQRCLIDGRSLLWPEQPAWTIPNIDALITALATATDDSKKSFFEKFQEQVATQPDDVLRVAADVLTFYYLFPGSDSVKPTTKLAGIQTILNWRPETLALSDASRQLLDNAFADGIGSPGTSFLTNRPWHLVFFLAFARGVLEGKADPKDAFACKRLIDEIGQRPKSWVQARHVLLHLLFPNELERIASENHKQKIIEAFQQDAGGASDLDDALSNIRIALNGRLGHADFDFYDPQIRGRWDRGKRDESAVRAVLEHAYPEAAVRGQCLRLLAESIRTAHAILPGCWGTTFRSGTHIRLNVGRLETLVLANPELRIVFDRAAADNTLWSHMNNEMKMVFTLDDQPFKVIPTAYGANVKINRIEEALSVIRPLHLALVRRAAGTVQRRTTFSRSHSPAVLEYLRTELDEEIPDPDYKSAVIDDAGASVIDLDSATSGVPYAEPSFADIVIQVAAQKLRVEDRTLRRYHLALKTRGFVILSGLSGTGKTWLAEVYATAVGARHAVIPIAPNWTTNEDLLGYHNPLTNIYHDTAFGRFLREAAAAWHDAEAVGQPAQPYHVVLDEMNLARVEYYFAKFLSAMETRARSRTAAIEFGPNDIVLLTPNLMVIGTVNIDETTHGFADKIYDRAQLVELEARREDIAAHMTGRPYQADLLRLWDDLHRSGPFTFRVLDEIAAYVEGADALGVTWEEALDEQLLHKVLPKIKGADPAVGEGLNHFVAFTSGRYPLSHARAQEMLEGFKLHGFASFFR